ncbi:MAG: AsnC family transcriptional regulator [Chitinivibrionales bacterium]|nr:AsnC family transcriptional regulator [Chitinivibrionales bacterium]
MEERVLFFFKHSILLAPRAGSLSPLNRNLKTTMDIIDKKILNLIQNDFPIGPHPFKSVGEKIDLGEQEVIARVRKLKDDGIIRRLGISLSPQKAGYTTTLVATKVDFAKLDEVTRCINAYPHITHNYLRDDDLNVWFTVIAEDRFEIENILSEISSRDGIEELLELPALNVFKLNVSFSYDEEQGKNDRQ